MAKPNKAGRNETTPFVQMLKPTLREPAWRDLSYGARCLYVTLKSYFNGSNNGRLYLSVRKAAEELGTSSLSSVERWFRELEGHGFIRKTERGYLGAEGKGVATYWRLTELGCQTDRPTRDYKDWKRENRTPYPKQGQSVPKIGTGRTDNRDSCSYNRDGFDPKSASACTDNRYVSSCHAQGACAPQSDPPEIGQEQSARAASDSQDDMPDLPASLRRAAE